VGPAILPASPLLGGLLLRAKDKPARRQARRQDWRPHSQARCLVNSYTRQHTRQSREEAPEIGGETTETGGEEENGQPAPKVSRNDQAELLRLTVDTVGQSGKPGEQIQNVISVGFLIRLTDGSLLVLEVKGEVSF
jgi:hypothetical protein